MFDTYIAAAGIDVPPDERSPYDNFTPALRRRAALAAFRAIPGAGWVGADAAHVVEHIASRREQPTLNTAQVSA